MDIHEVRRIIFERDGNKCYKCPSTTKLQMDHIDPKHHSHYHGVDNILTLCRSCNFKKWKKFLPPNEIESIKIYLDEVNKKFTLEEKMKMESIIKRHFEPKKKEPKYDWRDLCVPDKNGKINKWSMYRMRE